MTSDEIFDLISSSGYSYANALSISNSIYKKGIKEVSMIPRISGSLKSELSENFQIGIFIPCASEVSIDKSIKYLFSTEDGRKFETVYIPDNKRHTLCVSTQSGCRMGCSFCVTGRYGFHGNHFWFMLNRWFVHIYISYYDNCHDSGYHFDRNV